MMSAQQKTSCVFGVCLMLSVGAVAATISWDNEGGDSGWNNPTNWVGDVVPGTTAIDTALLDAGAEHPIVSSTVTTGYLTDILMRNNAKLTISSDMPRIRSLNIGTTGNGTSTVTHNAGTVTGSASATIGMGSGTGTASYMLSGSGALVVQNDLFLQAQGFLTLDGSSASLTVGNAAGEDLILSGNGELKFVLGASGVNAIDVYDAFTIDSTNSLLTIDASGLSAGVGVYELVTFGSISGAFSSDHITITGLPDGLSGWISTDVDSLNLVLSDAVDYDESSNWSSKAVSAGSAVTVHSNAVVSMDQDAVAGSLLLDGTLRFALKPVGNSSLSLSDRLTLGSAGAIEVDVTNYEGHDEYFPLILCSNLDSSLINSIIIIGSEVREPTVVLEEDGIWLRVIAPPSLSARICALIPASTVAAETTDSLFSATRSMNLSDSPWQEDLNEARVMDTLLSHQETGAGANNRSWEFRIGHGGQLYSFRTPEFGETVPPQSYGANSPWIDSVWQGVVVDSALNQSVGDYFIHQAGRYMSNDDPDQKESWYSPMVSSHLDEAGRSLTTVNWGSLAPSSIYEDGDLSNNWQSHVLYFNRYQDLGDGLIEVSLGCYNYGTDRPSHLNLPFGGVRRTALEHSFLSDPSGSWTALDNYNNNFIDNVDTGGWIAYCDSTNGTTSALGLVFGFGDTPFATPAIIKAYIRAAYYTNGLVPKPDETAWRNGHLFTNIRKFYLNQGTGVWCRYYFVLGDDVADVAARIAARGLIANATLTPFEYTEESTPLVAYRVSGSGATFQIQEDSRSPDFFLYAYPVTGSFPIYEIIEKDNTRHITWNPYATGVIDPSDGTLAGIRLLGFARRTADTVGSQYAYASLNTLMASASGNYFAFGETLSARTASAIETWRIKYFGMTDNSGDAANAANPDSDVVNNLAEYALGGNPLDAVDIGYTPLGGSVSIAGTNYFQMVYPRRTTPGNGLTYSIEASSNLLSNDWRTSSYIELPTAGTLDDDFEAVTNRIDTAGKTNAFFRIKVDGEI